MIGRSALPAWAALLVVAGAAGFAAGNASAQSSGAASSAEAAPPAVSGSSRPAVDPQLPVPNNPAVRIIPAPEGEAAVGGAPAGVTPPPAAAQASGVAPADSPPAQLAADERPPVPNAQCLVPPAKLSNEEVDAFLARPSDLLLISTENSLDLSNRVRLLAASDSRTLRAISALVPGATAGQKAAIGAGLGRAAYACLREAADYSAAIQAEVADLRSPETQLAFLSASRDVQTAATGGAGAGAPAAAAGLGGNGEAGPGSAGQNGDDVTPTLITEYGIGNSSGALLFDNDDGDDDDDSVSPTQIN